MAIYSDLGGSSAPVDPGLTEAEALLEAKKVSGYLGLLSPYYFGGVGTSTVISPSQANQWVDVNLSVDPSGLFDFRPADMVAADSAGFTGTGQAAQGISLLNVAGTFSAGDNLVSLSPPLDSSYTLEFLRNASTDLYAAVLRENGTNVGGTNYSIDFPFNGSIASGPTSVTDGTVTVDFSQVIRTSSNTLFVDSDNSQAGDPYLFTLCGLTQQSFGKMRVTGLFNPDIDESQLDVRLLFTPNSSGQFGQFSIAEQAATMSQGAGVEYFIEPTITFFVGDSIEEIGTVEASDAGRVQLQIRSSVEGEFTLRGLTLYIHS